MNSWIAMLPGSWEETRSQRWVRLNPEKARAYNRAYKLRNRDKINARKRQRYAQGKGRAA